MSGEWRHRPHWTPTPYCGRDGQVWPCDAETERNARLAAEGERDRLREALAAFVDNDTDHYDADGNQPVPPHDSLPDYCLECYRIRLGWIDAARAALTGAKE